jgi:hypothetical protein
MMIEPKFTDGPWEVDSSGYRAPGGGLCVMAGDLCIAVVQGDSEKPQEANARVIAAAPELLEALLALDDLRGAWSPPDDVIEAAWAKCCAAITKSLRGPACTAPPSTQN